MLTRKNTRGLLLTLTLTWLCSCSSKKPVAVAEPELPKDNEYTQWFAALPEATRKPLLKSQEDFFEGARADKFVPRARALEKENPVLNDLRPAENSEWFESFYETLVGAQLMAKANSFRAYKNAHCYDAFVRSLGASPLPPAAPLMSLGDFMRAGPRIPDENTYVQQVRLFCGRRAINLFQGLETPKLTKIYLTLKNNLVLQKFLLSRASLEASTILQAHRDSL